MSSQKPGSVEQQAQVTPGRCSHCTQATSRKCNGCNVLFYCSEECEKYEQHFHKALCSTNYNAKPQPSPGSLHRVLVFPVDSYEPHWAWISGYDDVYALLGPASIGLGHTDAEPAALALLYRDEFAFDGSKGNTSIKHVTRGIMPFDWRGPMVCTTRHEMHYYSPNSVKMEQVRPVIDFLRCYGSEIGRRGLPLPKGVQAVRIACNGEMEQSGIGRYTTHEVPHNSDFFHHADISPVSQRVGTPMLACKIELEGIIWDSYSNQQVAFLMRALDLHSSDFGMAPMSWQSRIGSAVVVRKDRGPLQPIDVEALSYLSQYHLQDDFEIGSEQDWP